MEEIITACKQPLYLALDSRDNKRKWKDLSQVSLSVDNWPIGHGLLTILTIHNLLDLFCNKILIILHLLDFLQQHIDNAPFVGFFAAKYWQYSICWICLQQNIYNAPFVGKFWIFCNKVLRILHLLEFLHQNIYWFYCNKMLTILNLLDFCFYILHNLLFRAKQVARVMLTDMRIRS